MKALIFFSFSIISLNSLGSSGDTLKKHTIPPVEYFKEKEAFQDQRNVPDTSVSRVDIYNQVYLQKNPYAYLGNIGSAARKLWVDVQSSGFDPGFHQLDIYRLRPDSIRYFNARKRFTDLFYGNGPKHEQILYLTHSQNIFKDLNAGIELRRIFIEGRYARQQTYTNNLAFFFSYLPQKGHYFALGNIIYNKITNEENGGLKSDPSLENIDKNAPVHLLQAENRWNETGFYLHHGLKLHPDSNMQSLFLEHTIWYDKRGFVYEDNPGNQYFYYKTYLDSLHTLDSTGVKDLSNKLGLAYRTKSGYFQAGGIYEYIRFAQSTRLGGNMLEPEHQSFINQGIYADLRFRLNGLMLEGGGKYYYQGYLNGNYQAKATLSYKMNNTSIGVYAEGSNVMQPYIWTRYFSNNFRWWFDSPTEMAFEGGAFFSPFKYTRISAGIIQLKNHMVFGSDAIPLLLDNVTGFKAKAYQEFVLGKFHLENTLFIQKFSSDSMRMPVFSSRHKFYVSGIFFHGALSSALGFDLFYKTAYYGNAYNPALGQFYIQNNLITEGYPAMDVFVNMKIKTARVFIKMENMLKGLVKGNYFEVPEYPVPARVLKFGVSWRFFD